jgi:hypothetical protein
MNYNRMIKNVGVSGVLEFINHTINRELRITTVNNCLNALKKDNQSCLFNPVCIARRNEL